jgi:hypothetical protein
MWSSWRNDNSWGKRNYLDITRPISTLFTINPTSHYVGQYPDRRDEKPNTIYQSK